MHKSEVAMSYQGHVENGVVVFDEPVKLPEGIRVRVELLEMNQNISSLTPLRGTPYQFDDPFSPAAGEAEWDACS